jgi:uncharacterized membrane protein
MICQASLTGLFRWVIIFFIIYIVFSALTRYVFPILLRNYLQNFSKKFNAGNPDMFQNQDNKEGEVKIKNIPDSPAKRKHAEDDEYVDYEEIKDKDNQPLK